MESSKQEQNKLLQIIFVIISVLLIIIGYFSLNLKPICYFYLNSHFLDRNSLHISSRTWLDQFLVKIGVFKIQMISLSSHKVDKLYPHINSNCSSIYNGKLNLPCIETEIYHHYINRNPQLNWLYISNTLNHVNFKNLLKYIKLLEKFADPQKHIIFKSHVSNQKISAISGWLVSRAFAQYIVRNNISFEKIAQISEGGFSHSAHTRLLSKIFKSTEYFNNPFMTDKICQNCDISPIETCPNQDNLYRASDFITTGMRLFPKKMQKFSRQINSYSSSTLLYDIDSKSFNICINAHRYKYHKLDLNEIQKNTPLIENIEVPKIEGNENKGFIPKYTKLLKSNYTIYNYNPSKKSRCVFFCLATTNALSKILKMADYVKQMELYKNRTIEFVFVLENQPLPDNFTMTFVTSPCHPFRDGPYGLSCKNDFLNRIFLEYFNHTQWMYRMLDDTLFDLPNLIRYFNKMEEFIDPKKHIILKCLITEYFKNIEYVCGGVGWIMSKRLIEYFHDINFSFIEFSRFSHEMQDDTALSHIAWSLFNSTKFVDVHFLVDMKCVECDQIYKEKSDKSIKACPANVRVTKASDVFGYHSIGYTPSMEYFYKNRKKFNPKLAIHFISPQFVYHICVADDDQLDSIDSVDLRKTTPILSYINTTRILRPDDYSNYYYPTRELF